MVIANKTEYAECFMRKTFTNKVITLLFLMISCAVSAQTVKVISDENPQNRKSRTEIQKRRQAARQQKNMTAAKKMADAAGPTLHGYITSSYGEYFTENGNGIYSFKTETTDPDFTFEQGGVDASEAGAYAGGLYYAVSETDNTFRTYDTKNGWTQQGSDIQLGYWVYDLAYDPVSKKLYASYANTDFTQFYFGTLNPADGTLTQIGDAVANVSGHLHTLAVTKDGELYGVRFSDRHLLHVNKATGATTDVGSVVPMMDGNEMTLFGVTSATFDWNTGIMYWIPQFENADSGLYSVSLDGSGASATVKEVTLLKNFGYESPEGTTTTDYVAGIYIEQEAAVTTAPEQPAGLSLTFENGQLTGKVSFTMPSKYTDGTDITSLLGYEIKAGDVTKTGTAQPGDTVEEQITLTADGNYTVSVTAKDGQAASQPATATAYIGLDTPEAVTDAALTADGSTMNVTWTAPAKGANGGYISNLTYNVKRYPGGTTVAEGTDKTSFSETLGDAVRAEYYYEITAICGGKEGKAAQTNKVTMGSLYDIPYSETFDEETSVSGYTFIDGNRDGKVWQYAAKGNSEAQYKQALWLPSPTRASDDWAITPGFKMSAGNLYRFSMKVQSNLEQTFNVMAGSSATADAMDTEIMPTTTYAGAYSVWKEYTGTMQPQADGTFYFGIHSTTDIDYTSDMFVDNIQIDAVPGTCPDKAENLVVTPGEKGALNATITFNAPTKRINGTALESLTDVKLYRDDQLLKTYSEVIPEQKLSYEDNSVSNGLHTYSVVAANEDGQGDNATVKKFIGIDAPGAVRNLTIVEDWKNEPGTLVATWDAPETGQNGGYVDPEGLTYYEFVSGPDDINLGNVTTLRKKVDISAGQKLDGYSIYAVNSTGSGKEYRETASQIIGPALTPPVYESFAGIKMKSGPWPTKITNGKIGEAYWDLFDGSQTEAGSQDGDGGVAYFETVKTGLSSRFYSPKVDVSSSSNPYLVFYVYHTGKKDKLDVQVSSEYGTFNTVKSIVMSDKPKGWQRYEIPLADYKDKAFIQVGFEGLSVETTSKIFLLDNISVRDLVDHDIEAGELTAPNSVSVGKEAVFSLTVKNHGKDDVSATDYSVELYKNDKLAATVQGAAIAADRSATVTLKDVPTIDDEEFTSYYAKVSYASDQVADNNQSESKTVRIDMPKYPSVSDLKGQSGSNGVELRWSEPNISDMPADPITENFESYKDFIINGIGNWTVVDGDGAKTISLSLDGETPLKYDNAGLPMAFQVFNPLNAGIFYGSWTPHSGDKMMVAFANVTEDSGTATQNDDWLISPELNGLPQTISFYAKIAAAAAPEDFEVRYSTTDNNIDSFTEAQGSGVITATNATGWEEYRIDLPKGAKYFAIRYVSTGQVALMIDDITYVPAGAIPEEVTLMGYNVYRDGQKLNGEPEGETSYNDADVENGKTYTYKVTAVYDKGESVYSNECVITYAATGISGTASGNATVKGGNGMITITGAAGQPVRVTTAAGASLFNGTAKDNVRIPAASGVYIVSVGGKAVKIHVR